MLAPLYFHSGKVRDQKEAVKILELHNETLHSPSNHFFPLPVYESLLITTT